MSGYSSSSANSHCGEPVNELIILHLSDLHFGCKSRFADLERKSAENLGKTFFEALRHSCEELGITRKVDLVIVSGDVSESGKTSEFGLALSFLRGLGGAIGLSDRHFVFVPGNHDISWTECKKVDLDIESEVLSSESRREEIDKRKLTTYEKFLQEFHTDRELKDLKGCRSLARGGWVHDFEEYSLSVAALNSCEKESHEKCDHIGKVSSEQSQSLLNLWAEEGYESWLKIVVVHHNPIATTESNRESWRKWLLESGKIDSSLLDRYEADVCGFVGAESLQQICDSNLVQLVLHGHHHETGRPLGWRTKGGGSAWVLSTGSWGLAENQLPGSEPCSCQLLRIVLEREHKVFAHRLVFDKDFWLRGQASKGQFRVLEPNSHNEGLSIHIPGGYKQAKQVPSFNLFVSNTHCLLDGFIKTYRDRMHGLFTSWDLRPVGTTQGGGPGQAVEANLDDMYLPLRFATEFDPSLTNKGKQLTADMILARQLLAHGGAKNTRRKRKQKIFKDSTRAAYKPIVIRAPAGSGKTTWMRYTFRQLLRLENALPVMVVLRDVAALWKEPAIRGTDRSIDQFLDHWVDEHLGTGWSGKIRELLEASNQSGYSGPRVILLVDGWDELGDFGRDFRAKLEGLRRTFPKLQVVVTSRPYGDERPSEASGYEELTIQPLSDTEIERLARNFFARCYKLEPRLVDSEWSKFHAALGRSPEAQSLARTALLLTMMLLISRSEPLPDKRHQLYDRCLHNLLTALPQTRASGGALDQAHQWRPADSDERRRVVARLAFDLQNTGYQSSRRGAIVTTWQQARSLLPALWKIEERDGFIAWLAGPSGVLTDRSDGTLVFTHLSFQEFMAAWHLKAASTDSLALINHFDSRVENKKWWETLLLCGALVGAESQERMDSVLKELIEKGGDSLLLSGLLFADGVGTSDSFVLWTERWSAAIRDGKHRDDESCVRAWRASQQHSRRSALDSALSEAGSEARWSGWFRLKHWKEDARLNETVVRPSKHQFSNSVRLTLEPEQNLDPTTIALGRLWAGGFQFFPSLISVGCLNLWPTARSFFGRQYQTAASLGATQEELVEMVRSDFSFVYERSGFAANVVFEKGAMRYLLQLQSNDVELERRALAYYTLSEMANVTTSHSGEKLFSYRSLAPGMFAKRFPDMYRYMFRKINGDHSREMVNNFDRIIGHYLFQSLKESFSNWSKGTLLDFKRHLIDSSIRDLVNGGSQHLDPLAITEHASKLVSTWNIQRPVWIEDLVLMELSSFWAGFAPNILAVFDGTGVAWIDLMAGACRELLGWSKPASLNRALSSLESSIDPLWPALARHINMRSTAEDQALLKDLANYPERREPPLSWGLQYLVRGDVLLESGTVITLDELAKEARVEPLPFLERIRPGNLDRFRRG